MRVAEWPPLRPGPGAYVPLSTTAHGGRTTVRNYSECTVLYAGGRAYGCRNRYSRSTNRARPRGDERSPRPGTGDRGAGSGLRGGSRARSAERRRSARGPARPSRPHDQCVVLGPLHGHASSCGTNEHPMLMMFPWSVLRQDVDDMSRDGTGDQGPSLMSSTSADDELGTCVAPSTQ